MKTTKLAVAIPLAFQLLCFAQSGPAPNPSMRQFAGTWTVDEAKSKYGTGTPLRFQATPDGGLEEVRGPVAAPLAEPVHFDGKSYAIDSGKGTIVWIQTGPNRFERQSFADGKLVSTRRLQISDDNRTLTEELGQKRTDGTTNLVTSVYGRSSGEGSGLAGTWAFQSRHSANPAQFTATVAAANSLKVVRRNGVTFVATPDNKPVPLTGPGVISGALIAFRQIDDNTFAETDSRSGAVTASFLWTISPDGKVLTVTGAAAGGNTPTTLVYEKQ